MDNNDIHTLQPGQWIVGNPNDTARAEAAPRHRPDPAG